MMKNSISNRIRMTKRGKIIRRAMGLSHSRGNKTSKQMGRKQKSRGINLPQRTMKRYL